MQENQVSILENETSGDFRHDDTEGFNADFSNSFWGKNERGVEVLLNKLRKAKHNSQHLKSILSSRAAIEDEYSKKLFKLAKTVFEEEYSNVGVSLQIFLNELHSSAKTHQQLSLKLKDELVVPLSNFIEEQRGQRKEQASIVERSSKSKSLKTALLMKTKDKYLHERTKCEGLESQLPNMYGKEFEKAQTRIERTNKLQSEILDIKEELIELNRIWQHDWKSACTKFQQLEENRIEFFKKSLWSYANLISNACVEIDSFGENIRSGLEKVQVENEILAFIEEKQTGNEPEFVLDEVLDNVEYVEKITNKSQPSSINNAHNQHPVDISPQINNVSKRASAKNFLKKALHISTPNSKPTSSNNNNIELPSQNKNYSDVNMKPSQSSIVSQFSTQQPLEKPKKTNSSLEITNNQPIPPIKQEINNNELVENRIAQSGINNNSNITNNPKSESIFDSLSEIASQLETTEKNNHNYSTEKNSIKSNNTNSISRNNIQNINSESSYTLFYVKVLYPYAKESEEEMTLVPGQLIKVQEVHEDGWWYGDIVDFESGKTLDTGVFPSNFTARIE